LNILLCFSYFLFENHIPKYSQNHEIVSDYQI
jgi:hypothetical protein